MPAASAKQVNFITKLLTERTPSKMPAKAVELLDVREASEFIGLLLDSPRKALPTAEALTPGIYKHDNQVFVVKPARETKNLYAKRLIEIKGQRATEAGTRVEIEFEYAPGIIRHIRASEKMGFEEAKALTIRYGRCICCGRHLKAAESVEQGIGPVCRKLFVGVR